MGPRSATVLSEMITHSDLSQFSSELRLKILNMHRIAGAGHLGSSLSIVEMLAVLSERFIRWQKDTSLLSGDRLVLSKGHAAMALYSLLALKGHIDEELYRSFGKNGSSLEPHPNELLLPDIHVSSGSLGQGLSVGVGLALGSRMLGNDDRIFVILGDGELNEGQVWEAARSAAHLNLSNLFVILDDNQMQQDGSTTEIMPVQDSPSAFEAMGWSVAKVDGHDCKALESEIEQLLNGRDDSPMLLHASTVKGRGVSFLEGLTESHFPAPLSAEEFSMVEYQIRKEV